MRNKLTYLLRGVIAILALASADVAFARSANDDVFSFSTPGTDTYADGTTVYDGECYALVWVSNGYAFQGFFADGSLQNSTGSVVVAIAPVAKNGRCPLVNFQISESLSDKIAALSKANGGGRYEVYLMDTRVRDASGALVAGSVGEDGKPTAVNGYSKIAADVSTGRFSLSSASGASGGSSSMMAAMLPPSCPVPVVTDFRVENGTAKLKVSGTASYAQYNVLGADMPTSPEFSGVSIHRQGDTGGEIEFEVPVKDGCRFFKVSCDRGL